MAPQVDYCGRVGEQLTFQPLLDTPIIKQHSQQGAPVQKITVQYLTANSSAFKLLEQFDDIVKKREGRWGVAGEGVYRRGGGGFLRPQHPDKAEGRESKESTIT